MDQGLPRYELVRSGRTALSAISAMDIALWDLKRKERGAAGLSIAGWWLSREKVQLYAGYWFIDGGHNPEDYARQARRVTGKGFPALKFDPFAHISYWYGEDLHENNGLTEAQKAWRLMWWRLLPQAVGPDV